MPSLPVTMDNMAGALVGHSLYIVGGNVNGIPSSAMYMLDLSDLSGGWKRETDIQVNPEYNLFAWHKMENFMCGGICPGC